MGKVKALGWEELGRLGSPFLPPMYHPYGLALRFARKCAHLHTLLTKQQNACYNTDNGGFMYIYGMVDPNGPEIFYVGCTVNLARRLRKHSNLANKSAGKKVRERIRQIKHTGGLPEMVILEQTEDESREYAWIAFFSDLGLINTARKKTKTNPKKTPVELSAIARASWVRKRQKFQGFSNEGWKLR
jgi:hypothetical protein